MHASLHAPAIKLRIVTHHGDARRVLTAVFETPQSFDKDGYHIAFRDSSDNSAHGSVSSCL